jgi:DNA-binding Lrp family transcriptional regulator
MRRYRRGARFVMDARTYSRPLDRNERARIYVAAKALEVRTKAPGARMGVLGLTGLFVLDCLLFGFMRRSDGLCCPSVRDIQEKTGLSRSAIFEALNRLEAAGIVTRVRRLVRRLVDFGGMVRLTTVQTSNLYSFDEPGPNAHLLPIRRRIRNDAARLVAKLAKAFSIRTGSGYRPETILKGFSEEERTLQHAMRA